MASYLVKGAIFLLIPAIPGVYFYLNNLDSSMPPFLYIQNPTASKFGADFQFYLSEASSSFKESDKWWEWSYKNKYLLEKKKDTPDLSTEFQDLGDFKALKSKCDETYKKDSTDLKDTEPTNNKAKYGRDAWRYCSIFSEKPKTVEDNKDGTDSENLKSKGPYEGKIGSSKKSELISVTDTGINNKKFWELREMEFFGLDSKNGIGKYNEQEKTTNEKKNIFDKLYDDKETTTIYTGEKIKKTCEEAYKETTSDSEGKVKDTDVVKFCGLKITKVS